ncbi:MULTISPECIES: L,D-transpeptidase family protein [Persephonella]|nr:MULTISPECIES: L,D-transpeptidase family protein [Persephonella]
MIILTVLLTNIFSSFAVTIDDLIEDAYKEVRKEKSEDSFNLALKAFNEGIFSVAVKEGKKYLKLHRKKDIKRDIIIEMIAVSYYRMYRRKELFDHLIWADRQNISRDIKLKIFQLANNLFVEKKDRRRLKIIKKRFSNLFRSSPPFFIHDERFKRFKPNINIFKLKYGNIIGENSLYRVKKNTTLIEIAKELDLGYDEIRVANPHIDPFDVQKGMVVLIPRKRLLPEKEFNFGEIYLNLSEKRLYYPVIIDDDPYVISIPVGIGTDENRSPIGDFFISEKRKNPAWYVPDNIKEEDPSLPDIVPPGPNNPLGTRAMRLSNTTYLLHGTSKRFGIGMKVSHGCIRMYNEDVEALFDLVETGTKVHIYEKNYKIFKNRHVYIEIYELDRESRKKLLDELSQKGVLLNKNFISYLEKERRGYVIPLY